MPSKSAQKRSQRTCDDLPERQTAAGSIGAQHAHGTRWKLQGNRNRGFLDRHWMAKFGGLLEISIGLAPGQSELARQTPRRLGQLRAAREQTRACAQPAWLGRLG